MRREKIGDTDQYALLIWEVVRGQKTETVNSLLKEQKNIEWVCTKQYEQLLLGATSHGLQMGEGLCETEVQRMVCNTVTKWIRK